MKPAKLKIRLATKHAEFRKKSVELWEEIESLCQEKVLIQHTVVQKKIPRASYKVSYLIADTKKRHKIREPLIISVIIKIKEILQGKQYSDKLKFVPLLDDTLIKQITEISDDMHEQLLESTKKTYLQFNLNQVTFPNYGKFLSMFVIALKIVCTKTHCFVIHSKKNYR
jgi:hypothetical protein